ncbi:MAG: hypothetical protein M1833_001361 [Piccolia ochrophora]|nr:MAG: hypothetical protein M1833_001361 [Piccolia ochrophora]
MDALSFDEGNGTGDKDSTRSIFISNPDPETFFHDRSLNILVCLSCQVCIASATIANHLREKHGRYAMKSRVQDWADTLETMSPRDTLPRRVPRPIVGVPTFDNGLSCEACQFAARTDGTMRKHIQTTHKNQGVSYRTNVQIQQPWGKATPTFIVIDDGEEKARTREVITNNFSDVTRRFEETLNSEAMARAMVPVEVDKSEKSAWSERTRWHEHLANVDMTPLVRRAMLPEPQRDDDALLALCDRLHMVVVLAQANARLISNHVLCYVKSHLVDTPSEAPAKFNVEAKTLDRYVNYWKRFLAYVWRSRDNAAEQRMPWEADMSAEFNGLVETFGQSPLQNAAMANGKIVRFCETILSQRVDADVWKSPLIHFLAVLGWDEKGTQWRTASQFTPILAGIIYVARLLLLEVSYPVEERKTSEGVDRFKEFHRLHMTQRSGSAYSDLTHIMAKGRKIGADYGKPTIYWPKEGDGVLGGDILTYLDQSMSMSSFRNMVSAWIDEADNVLTGLAFATDSESYLRPINPAMFTDSLHSGGAGFSFLDVEKNEKLTDGYQAIVNRMARSPQNKYLVEESEPLRIRKGGLTRYLKELDRFLMLLLLLVHFTGGGTARGTELASIKWQNTANSRRNIYVVGEHVMCLVEYHKSEKLSGHPKVIPRFLPFRVGRLMIAYLADVLLFSRWLASSIDEPERVVANDYVWVKDFSSREPISSTKISVEMGAASEPYLGFGLQLHSYRQIHIAIRKRYLDQDPRTGSMEGGAGENDGAVDVDGALQSGHSSRTESLHYALTVTELNSLTDETMRQMRRVSTRWHEFLQLRSSVPLPQAGAPTGTPQVSRAPTPGQGWTKPVPRHHQGSSEPSLKVNTPLIQRPTSWDIASAGPKLSWTGPPVIPRTSCQQAQEDSRRTVSAVGKAAGKQHHGALLSLLDEQPGGSHAETNLRDIFTRSTPPAGSAPTTDTLTPDAVSPTTEAERSSELPRSSSVVYPSPRTRRVDLSKANVAKTPPRTAPRAPLQDITPRFTNPDGPSSRKRIAEPAPASPLHRPVGGPPTTYRYTTMETCDMTKGIVDISYSQVATPVIDLTSDDVDDGRRSSCLGIRPESSSSNKHRRQVSEEDVDPPAKRERAGPQRGSLPLPSNVQPTIRRAGTFRSVEEVMTALYGPSWTFRSALQEEAVRFVANPGPNSGAIMILPTAGGKTLTFMVAAKLDPEPCQTVVVVPFVALLDGLKWRCRRAGIITVQYHEGKQCTGRVILVSAEAAGRQAFRTFVLQQARKGELKRIVFDEAHVIPKDPPWRWQDQSVKLELLRDIDVPKFFLTATLPRVYERKLREAFALDLTTKTIRGSTERVNISYNVQLLGKGVDVTEAFIDIIAEHRRGLPPKGKLIVYGGTTQRCEALGARLEVPVYYNKKEQKETEFQRWLSGETDTIIGTSAIGSGIDIDGVIAILHLDALYTLTDFGQESGRAGRSGEAAISTCVLSRQGIAMLRNASSKNDPSDKQACINYALSGRCRREVLNEWFDQDRISCGQRDVEPCDICRVGPRFSRRKTIIFGSPESHSNTAPTGSAEDRWSQYTVQWPFETSWEGFVDFLSAGLAMIETARCPSCAIIYGLESYEHDDKRCAASKTTLHGFTDFANRVRRGYTEPIHHKCDLPMAFCPQFQHGTCKYVGVVLSVCYEAFLWEKGRGLIERQIGVRVVTEAAYIMWLGLGHPIVPARSISNAVSLFLMILQQGPLYS